MSKEYKYDLTFDDVLKEIFNGGWFQGEDFADGVFIKVAEFSGVITTYEFRENQFGCFEIGTTGISKGLLNQKFRRCVAQVDVMRKY